MTSKRIVVIGAGPGGIYTGLRLLERGHDDVVIYEKERSLGGTWWRNRYPGNACDVPALNYSFSIHPNIEATRTFEGGEHLHRYFSDLADTFGVSERIVYETRVVDATWNGARWSLTLSSGETTEADIVISAVGRLHNPNYPDIEGLDDFGGLMVHSTFWDPEYDLAGKRLGVIGSGSSGVQILSEASKVAGHVSLFQRTPHWVMPVPNEPIPEDVRRRYREDPAFLRKSFDDMEVRLAEVAALLTTSESTAAKQREKLILDALASVRDPDLRAKLTPDYAIGCKRLILSSEYYEAVQRPNVAIETERIERIEERGVRTSDGVLHELEVIILATGFHADSYLRPMTVAGEGGVTLDDIWRESFVNYKSVALPHMPNLFTVNGPFSPGGSLSILMVIENHVDYIVQLVDRIVAEDVAVAPDPERSEELVRQIQERAKGTVWYTGGCTSWYLDKNGVPLVNPLSLDELRADMEAPVWDDFVVTPIAASASSSR